MRKTFIILTGFAVAGILVVSSCNSSKQEANGAAMDSAALVKRGDYLVTIMGCDDCHSPKKMGAHGPEIIPELRLSGFPHDGKLGPVDTNQVKNGWAMLSPDLTSAVGPWGQSFAGNITSDDSGIGTWSEEQFTTALRKGKLKGMENGRNLLPPMPWFNYSKLADNDIKAIYAFLKTTKPVSNVVPAPKAFPELK